MLGTGSSLTFNLSFVRLISLAKSLFGLAAEDLITDLIYW